MSVQAEQTKMGHIFQVEGESIGAWKCRALQCIVNMGTLRIKLIMTGSLLV